MSCELEKRGESFGCVNNLRMQIKDVGGHSSESPRIGDRLSRAVSEMMATLGEILDLSKEAETALTKEKLKSEKLQKMVDELNESILELKLVGTKAEEKAANKEEEVAVLKKRLDEIRSEGDRVLEAQVENALLKVELHKWRSKAAAAEAAEERSKSEKFALNRALQLAATSHQESEQKKKLDGKTQSNNINNVTISRKEYEALLNMADEEAMKEQKLGKLERELMTGTHKMRELRTRAEQAISRAEAAEKAKAEIEDKLKRRKEKEKEKKEFFKNLREQMNSREAAASPDFTVKNTPAIQTLSNVLEIPL